MAVMHGKCIHSLYISRHQAMPSGSPRQPAQPLHGEPLTAAAPSMVSIFLLSIRYLHCLTLTFTAAGSQNCTKC